MDLTECSETSAHEIQMPENYPEESTQTVMLLTGQVVRTFHVTLHTRMAQVKNWGNLTAVV